MKNNQNRFRIGKHGIATILVSFTFVATGSHAVAGQTSLISGIDYSSGKYGETDTTDIVYLPVTIKHSAFPWTVKVTVPYISITGPDSVTADANGTVLTASSSPTQSTDSGLGDTVASLSYALDTWWGSAPYVDLTGKIKFPTADSDKRLGTGETDYQAQLDIAHTIGGSTPFVTLGYKIMGDTDATDFNNVIYASLGANQRLNKTLSAGFSYDFMEATTVTSSDRNEVMGYINWKVNPAFSINTYAVTGLTDASPDFALGVQFTLKQKNP